MDSDRISMNRANVTKDDKMPVPNKRSSLCMLMSRGPALVSHYKYWLNPSTVQTSCTDKLLKGNTFISSAHRKVWKDAASSSE